MPPILALALKDLRLLVRDRVGLFFTCVFPVLFAIFFGMMFSSGSGGGKGGVRLAVVDEARTELSRQFLDTLRAAEELRVDTEPQPGAEAYSREQAEDLVRKGRRAAFVVIPQGFDLSLRAMFSAEDVSLEVGVDPSRKAEALMLQGVLTRYAFQLLAQRFTEPAQLRDSVALGETSLASAQGVDPLQRVLLQQMFKSLAAVVDDAEQRTADAQPGGVAGAGPFSLAGIEPLRVRISEVHARRSGPTSAFAVTFAQGAMWAIVGCVTAFAMSMVHERTRGTLVRLRVAPLSWAHILLGKALGCFLSTVAVSAVLLGVSMLPPFDVRPVSPALLPVALVSISLCFVGIMMTLAAFCRTETAAGSIGWAVMLVLMMVGGGTIPVFWMPRWMQGLSQASPVRWALIALEGPLWRGLSLTEMALPCAILVGVGTAGIVVGVWMFRRREFAS